jgi:hypothetical protein
MAQTGGTIIEGWNADDVHWRGGIGTLWSGRGERWHDARALRVGMPQG